MTLLHIHQCTTHGNVRLALRDKNVFLELKVRTTSLLLFQIHKLVIVIFQTFIVPT